MVEVIDNANYSDDLSFHGPREVKQVYWEDSSGVCIGVEDDSKECVWSIAPHSYQVVEPKPKQELAPNYAAAFNMWMNDFVNAPQTYEDLHSTAIRHLTEKLNGEELSYGMICEQMLIEYLEKVK